jgi:hypothetical protein
MQNYDETTCNAFSRETGAGDDSILEANPSADLCEITEDIPAAPAETQAQRRRRQRIELVEEFGGHAADLKQVAMEAKRRGMYSPRTNRGDVELCLLRTWKLRNRAYGR